MHLAARSGDIITARLLLAHGADLDASDDQGHTVLDCAEYSGNLALIDLVQTALLNR